VRNIGVPSSTSSGVVAAHTFEALPLELREIIFSFLNNSQLLYKCEYMALSHALQFNLIIGSPQNIVDWVGELVIMDLNRSLFFVSINCVQDNGDYCQYTTYLDTELVLRRLEELRRRIVDTRFKLRLFGPAFSSDNAGDGPQDWGPFKIDNDEISRSKIYSLAPGRVAALRSTRQTIGYVVNSDGIHILLRHVKFLNRLGDIHLKVNARVIILPRSNFKTIIHGDCVRAWRLGVGGSTYIRHAGGYTLAMVYKPNPTTLRLYAFEMQYVDYAVSWLKFNNDVKVEVYEISPATVVACRQQQSDSRDYMVKLIEDIMVLVYTLSKCENMADLSFCAVNFIKIRSNVSLYKSLKDFELIEKIKEIFDWSSDEPEQQSFEDFVGTCRELLDNYTSICQSPLVKKITKLMYFCLTKDLLAHFDISYDSLGYSILEKEAISRKHNSSTSFAMHLADFIVFFCERGIQVYKTGDPGVIFHSSVTYTKFKNECELLQRQFKNIGRAEALGFTEEEFDKRLSDAIRVGSSIEKYSGDNTRVEQRVVSSMINSLRMIEDDRTIMKCNEEERDLPFSVLICGTSGIGKGSIKDMLFKLFAEHNNLPKTRDCRYTRTPDQEYWPDYKTHKYCIILDDIAFLAPKFAMGVDPTVKELLRIVNTVPWVTPQADLDSKGKIPLRCKLVLATTNTEHLNAYHYFSCPSAVQRRFPYVIKPVVHPNYATETGDLDSSKTDPTKFPDYWLWTVKSVSPRFQEDQQGELAITKTILKNASLKDFLKWYHDAMTAHNEKVQTINESTEVIYNTEICKICFDLECVGHEQSCGSSNFMYDNCVYNFFLAFWYLLVFKILDWFLILADLPLIRLGLFTFDQAYTFDRWLYKWLSYIRKKKEFWTTLGDKMYNRFGIKTKTMAKLLAELVFLYGLIRYNYAWFKIGYKTTDYVIDKVTGRKRNAPETDDVKESQSGVVPKPDGVEVQNVWYQKDFGLSVMDVSLATRSLQGSDPDKLMRMFQHNIVNFVCKETKQRTGALCIKGHIYVLNAHFIPDLPEFTLKIKQNENSISPNIVFTIKKDEIRIDRKNDLAFLVLNKVPPRKDLTDFILRKKMDIRADGYYFIREFNGELTCKRVRKIQPQAICNRSIDGFGWKCYVDLPTKQGDCGSPLVMMSAKGPIIVGIHALGFNSEAFSMILDLEYINSIVALENDVGVEMLPLQSESAPRELTGLHTKSVFRYFSGGTGDVYGTFKGHRAHGKSSVQKTPISEMIVEKFDVPITHTKPMMQGWLPWRIAAQDLINVPTRLDICKLESCIEGYIRDVEDRLPKRELDKFEVYTDFVAVNGALGVAHVDSMKMGTSAGNPYRKSKRFYIHSVPEQDGLEDAVMPSEEILTRVRQIESSYRQHNCVRPNFCAHLKDEPVTFKKAESGKTRVFTGAPFDWTIVVRKYLLSAIRVIQRNRLLFEAGPGTVAQSTQWQDIYHYLTKFGKDRIVAGDYKSFDKRMAPEFILAAFRILRHFCKRSGNYSKEDLYVIDCIANDTAFPLVDYNGDLVQFYGSNPSGHPLTVIINSLVNSLYVRYCYITLNPEEEVTTFKDKVALMTYGDDNIMGIANDIPWMNHTTISEALRELDVTYTMADKEAESVPYIHIDDATFLKRRWRFDADVGAYVAPLEKESIYKSLTVWVRSKAVVEQEQLISVVASAVREFFWYGKDEFIANRQILKDILLECGYEQWIEEWVFPTYDELKDAFWEVSKKLAQD